jgi:hypothetical protein
MWSSSCGPASPTNRRLVWLRQLPKTLWTFCITVKRSVSVAMEEIKSQDWVETVYTPDIKLRPTGTNSTRSPDMTRLTCELVATCKGMERNRNEALRRYTHLVFPFRYGSIAGTDEWDGLGFGVFTL